MADSETDWGKSVKQGRVAKGIATMSDDVGANGRRQRAEPDVVEEALGGKPSWNDREDGRRVRRCKDSALNSFR